MITNHVREFCYRVVIGYGRGKHCLEGSKQFSWSPDATEINISIGKVRPVALVLTLHPTLLSHMSDQDRISPYNINTISIRQVVRIFVLDIFSIGQTKKFTTICIPTD